MTRLSFLERRRELVLRSAKLQRATIAIRLNRIEASPVTTVIVAARGLLGTPWARRAAVAVLGIALRRMWRKARAPAAQAKASL